MAQASLALPWLTPAPVLAIRDGLLANPERSSKMPRALHLCSQNLVVAWGQILVVWSPRLDASPRSRMISYA